MSYLFPLADQAIASQTLKQRVRLLVPAAISLASSHTSLDNLTLDHNDRVLLAFQPDARENGIYTWSSATRLLTRSLDANLSSKMAAGLMVAVTEGSSADSYWILKSDDPIVLGFTNIYFIPVNGPMLEQCVAFVNPQASNASDNSNLLTPFVTISGAVSALTSHIPSSPYKATCLISPGVYPETVIVRDSRVCLVGLGAGSLDVVIAPSVAQMPALVFTNAAEADINAMLAGGPGGYAGKAPTMIPSGLPPQNCEVANLTLRGEGNFGYGLVTVATTGYRCSLTLRQVVATNWNGSYSTWSWNTDNEVLSCPNRVASGLGYNYLYNSTLNVRNSVVGRLYLLDASSVDLQHCEVHAGASIAVSLTGASKFGRTTNRGGHTCSIQGNVNCQTGSEFEASDTTISGSLSVAASSFYLRKGRIGGSVNVTSSSILEAEHVHFASTFVVSDSTAEIEKASIGNDTTLSNSVFSATGSSFEGDFSTSGTIGPVTLRQCFIRGELYIDDTTSILEETFCTDNLSLANGADVTMRRGGCAAYLIMLHTSALDAEAVSVSNTVSCSSDSSLQAQNSAFGNGALLSNQAVVSLRGCSVTGSVTAGGTSSLTILGGNAGSLSMNTDSSLEAHGLSIDGDLTLSSGAGSARMVGGQIGGDLTDPNDKLIWSPRPIHVIQEMTDALSLLEDGQVFLHHPTTTLTGETPGGNGSVVLYTGTANSSDVCTDGVALYLSDGNNVLKYWIAEDGTLGSPAWTASTLGAFGEDIEAIETDGRYVYVGFEDTSGGGHASEGLTVLNINTGAVVRTNTASPVAASDIVDIVSNGQMVVACKGDYVVAWDIGSWAVTKWAVSRGATAHAAWIDGYHVWHVGVQPGAGWDIQRISLSSGAQEQTLTLPTVTVAEAVDIEGDQDHLYVLTQQLLRSDTGVNACLWVIDKQIMSVRFSVDLTAAIQTALTQDASYVYAGSLNECYRVSKSTGSRCFAWPSTAMIDRACCTNGRYLFYANGTQVKEVTLPSGPRWMWRTLNTDPYRQPNYKLVLPLVTK